MKCTIFERFSLPKRDPLKWRIRFESMPKTNERPRRMPLSCCLLYMEICTSSRALLKRVQWTLGAKLHLHLAGCMRAYPCIMAICNRPVAARSTAPIQLGPRQLTGELRERLFLIDARTKTINLSSRKFISVEP